MESCKSCHQEQYQQWQGSHHDLAMQEASVKTVLGNFSEKKFLKDGVLSTFFIQNERFMVNTDGPDGKLHDYEISYTFGVYPLQQYMVKFPKGKIQVLDIAWDSRKIIDGGQRWFSLHPDESIKADDVLHWTGPNLNWNYMCADCHSTNLKKNYNSSEKSYNTQYDAINVSCEACHGPASEHLNWANKDNKESEINKGLTINFPSVKDRHWTINKTTQKPQKNTHSTSKNKHLEVEQCAKCHSRRAQLDDNFVPGDNFRDHYLPSLLTESLYYPDGKIKDEVYVYGSFVQSKMYQQGVTCSDCHNTHNLELKEPGDLVCQQCHLPASYKTPEHHFHKEQSTGSSCIACHMPAKIYMGVDERNDHSFRIPRPDLAKSLGTPDACTLCHSKFDKTLDHKSGQSQWAAERVQQWYGKTPQGYQQFGPALQALEQQNEDALQLLYGAIINDTPNIAKATLIGYLGEYPTKQTLLTAMQMLRSKDADIRRQALQALQAFPLQHTINEIYAALNDPVKTVRITAISILAQVPRGSLSKEQKSLIDRVTEEYRQSLLFIAERPEAQLSLAQLYQYTGQIDDAVAAFKEALFLQPGYIPSYVNYANYLQQQGNETGALVIIQRGLNKNSSAAVLHHSLGLWYVRNKERQKGIESLRTAAALEPDSANYQYVYAVAISESSVKKAIQILQSALQKHTGNMEILMALASYYQQSGDEKKSDTYRKKAQAVMQYRN